MDIRNFFGAKKSSSAAAPKARRGASATPKRAVAASPSPSSSSSNRTTKRPRRAVAPENHDDDDDDSESDATTGSAELLTTTTTTTPTENAKRASRRKTTTTTTTTAARKELSAEEFFRDALAKPRPTKTTTTTTKKEVVDLDEDSDETHDDDVVVAKMRPRAVAAPSSAKTGSAGVGATKRRSVADSDEEDSDETREDDDDDEKVATPSNGRGRRSARPSNGDAKPRRPIADDSDVETGRNEKATTPRSGSGPRRNGRRRSASLKDDDSETEDEEFRDDDDDDDEFAPGDDPSDDVDLDVEEDNDDDLATPSPAASKGRAKGAPPRSKRRRTSPATPTPSAKAKAKAKSVAAKKPPPFRPFAPVPPFPSSRPEGLAPECLTGVTFVFTGNMAELSRDDAEDAVRELGGRVTQAVSSKTHYLVCGEILEDGRAVTEGSKYRRATELGETAATILRGGAREFYGLLRELSDAAARRSGATSTAAPVDPRARSAPPTNPYARRAPPTNPYATSTQRTVAPTPVQSDNGRAAADDGTALWADKYAPSSSREILGNGEQVKKLARWLDAWESQSNRSSSSFRPAALLSGPPGVGKTTTALLVAREAGREVLEWNASDVRSKRGLDEGLGDATGSRVLSFSGDGSSRPRRKRVVVMDEVDGMGAGDRSGMAELIKIIKRSRVPVICVCNDRQSPKVRSLAHHCLDLRYRRPVKTVVARRAVQIARAEGLRVEPNAAEAVAESCGNDVRQVLNCLQMWSAGGNTNTMTYKDLRDRQRDIRKDESLRLSVFDSTKTIVEGPKGVDPDDHAAANKSLYERCDAFFTDYSLMGLNVHQNYLKVSVHRFQTAKRSGDADDERAVLDEVHDAALAMSDFAVAEDHVRGANQAWQLLPLCSVLAVAVGRRAAGPRGAFFPGFPEFAGWLGKNSTRARRERLLRGTRHHVALTHGGGPDALRLGTLSTMRRRLGALLTSGDGTAAAAIDLMDAYGLDRDDLFETMDELRLDGDDDDDVRFGDLESKAKAAFTREYNKRAHTSQALVAEQATTTKGRKRAAAEGDGPPDLDAVDDDKGRASENENDDDDDDDDLEAVRKAFLKKGARAAKKKKTTTPTTTAKKGGGGGAKKRKKK